MSGDDLVAEVQIGRPLRAGSEVVTRCPLGLPVVLAVPPLLDDGTPFPTRYWLCCPLAVRRVGRLESAGGVRRMEAKAQADPRFGSRLAAAHSRYAADREALVPPGASPRPVGGVGGADPARVKCLHAHYADHAAGHVNPVGEAVAPWVEPLDCTVPCVVMDGGVPSANADWVEPR